VNKSEESIKTGSQYDENRYAVAMSLDGYIAGPNDEADWIVMNDQEAVAKYFKSFIAEFDTVLIGGRTWELIYPVFRSKF
jgi:dihydrofolate reductase